MSQRFVYLFASVLMGFGLVFYAFYGLIRGELSYRSLKKVKRVEEAFLFWSLFCTYVSLGVLLLTVSLFGARLCFIILVLVACLFASLIALGVGTVTRFFRN